MNNGNGFPLSSGQRIAAYAIIEHDAAKGDMMTNIQLDLSDAGSVVGILRGSGRRASFRPILMTVVFADEHPADQTDHDTIYRTGPPK